MLAWEVGAGLRAVRREVPEPAAGEVLVRVSACAVCRTDLHVIEGDLPVHASPVVPGHEVVGTVTAVGTGVTDHGPGVKPDERDKIFEPFFTGKTRGTGLGLAIAKRVVELHGGTIRVDGAPSGGALFRIEIPHVPHAGP